MKNSIKPCLPNNITAEEFLANYWQKKPLLIKQGLPNLIGMFEPADIVELSLDEEVTARLITQNNKPNSTPKVDSDYHWILKQNPLTEEDYANLPDKWTVLVQNLEQWSLELGQLWGAFNFIPQWQRDDIMVSYAPKGGSVGKHYDDYDVFLAQGYGHRRWQLGKYCDENTAFIENQPIRIFDDMGDITFDDVLEPGDVLYVPPKLSHYGVAQDNCLTFSFGFRRPNLMQVLDTLVDIATTEASLFSPLILEQPLQPAGKLENHSIEQIKTQLLKLLNSSKGDSIIEQAVSEVVSKRQYDQLLPEETLTLGELTLALEQNSVIRPDYSSRLLYKDSKEATKIYANGQPVEILSTTEADILKRLANGESFNGQQLVAIDGIDAKTIMDWLENGWIWLDF